MPIDRRAGAARRQAALLFATVLAAVLCCVMPALLDDPDTQWHVAVGRLIWRSRAVPDTDVFSHTFAGAPWIAKEWLSQLILFAAYAAGGWWSVALLTVAVVAATFALMFAFLLARLRWTVALAIVLVALPLAAPEMVARPHILVLPAIMLWMIELAKARERGTAPRWWVPGLMALWANMHASYPIGGIMAGVFALEALMTARAGERRRVCRAWAPFLILSVAAACVSPYGYSTLVVAFTLMQTSEATTYVSEWQPLRLDPQGLLALGALAVSVCVVVWRWRENACRAAALLLLGAMMIQHGRFALLFAMMAPVIVAGPLARTMRRLAPEGVRMPWAPAAIAVMATVATVVAGHSAPEPDPRVSPQAALRVAEARGLTGPVYNDYDYGGFLILHGIRTFIDGRNDQLFNGGFTTRLSAALASPGHEALAALLDRHDVTWALVKPRSEDARHLAAMPGWSWLFADADAALFARICVAPPCPSFAGTMPAAGPLAALLRTEP